MTPTAVTLAVFERLGLCADLLALRAKLGQGGNPVRSEVLFQRRTNHLRAQLMPGWSPANPGLHGAGFLAVGALAQELQEARSAQPAIRAEVGLKAQAVVALARMLDAEEVQQGLQAAEPDYSALTQAAGDMAEAVEPADTPDYMRGFTHADASMRRAIEEGDFGQQALDDARAAAAPVPYLSLEEIDPQAYAQVKAQSEVLYQLGEEIKALRDAPLEDSDEARAARVQALQALFAKQNALYAPYSEQHDALSARRAVQRQQLQANADQAKARVQSVIEGFKERSEVGEKDAKQWAQTIEITPQAEAALRKGGYPPTQVRKDAAEFFRFVRGRLDKVRITTHDKERAAANTPHGKPGQIFIPANGRDFNKRVLWHELGHHIEADPSAAAAARLFIRMRSEAGKTAKLKDIDWTGYEDDEVAFVDHFFSPYMGKIYDHGMTEIFSMVLESFSSPELLAARLHKDPQSFAFVRGFIDRPRDATEKLLLAMRQEARHVNDAAEVVRQEAQARKVAPAGFKADTTDYLATTPYARWIAEKKGKPLGYMPGSAPGAYVLLYAAQVDKPQPAPAAGGKRASRSKKKATQDGIVTLRVEGDLAQPASLTVQSWQPFRAVWLNWVLAYLIRWRAVGFASDKMPDSRLAEDDLKDENL